MTRVTGFALGFAGLMLTARTALAQRIRGIPIGGGDSDGSFGDAIPLIILLLGLIVLAVVLVIGLAQMLFHGGLHALMWSVVGMVNVYEWFRPPAELESKLEQKRLAAGRARVRKLLKKRLPQCSADQIERALDGLGFVDYLRLPMYVSVKQYDTWLLGISLPEESEKDNGAITIELTYRGEMFVQTTLNLAREQPA